jgi:iron complex transport system permease protein
MSSRRQPPSARFFVWADIDARAIVAPKDIPIGIVTGLIGGAFFI